MKKTISLILICIFIFVLCGCDNQIYHWEFGQDYTHITAIQIITTPNSERFDKSTYIVLKDIDSSYFSEFIEDTKQIRMTRHGPNYVSPSGLGILFLFDNGECDVIAYRGASHYKYDENSKIQEYSEWLDANPDDLLGVISKYLALD